MGNPTFSPDGIGTPYIKYHVVLKLTFFGIKNLQITLLDPTYLESIRLSPWKLPSARDILETLNDQSPNFEDENAVEFNIFFPVGWNDTKKTLVHPFL